MNIRSGTSKVYEAKSAIFMHNRCDCMIRRFDSRDVRTRGDSRNLMLSILELLQQFPEVFQVDISIPGRPDDLHRSNGLQPTDLIAVMFHMGHKNNRS